MIQHARAGTIAVAVLVGLSLSGPPEATAASRADMAQPVVPAVVISLDFGAQQTGTTSTPQTWTYTNLSAGEVTVSAALSGTNAGDFAIDAGTTTCGAAPLAASASCDVGVVFAPTAEYGRSASLDVNDGIATASIPLTGVGVLPASAVAWGTLRTVGPGYAWNWGQTLTRTKSSTTQYLHTLYNADASTYRGVYYIRSTAGTTWTKAVRLNPSTQHGDRATTASYGSYVYAAWSSIAKRSFTATQPRVLYFRRNASHGSGTWSTTKRLTSLTGRIDYPRLAAYGSDVYIAYTDAATGYIKLQVSHDRGSTWTVKTIGSTTRKSTYGRLGVPVVAVAGSNVVVAWIASDAGVVRVRSSANRGSTWSSTLTLGTGAAWGSFLTMAMSGSRTAVAWVNGKEIDLRVRLGTTWGPVRAVQPSPNTTGYADLWIPAVALNGTTRVGVAFEACYAGCSGSGTYQSDLLWRESADNGATWAHDQVVGTTPLGGWTENYSPSIVWASTSTRYVLMNRYDAMMGMYRLFLRSGAGVP